MAEDKNTDEKIDNYASQIAARRLLATKLGNQYDGNRNIYEALGYKTNAQLDYDDYRAKYDRMPYANAIIDRPAKAAWNGGFSVTDDDNPSELTTFEESFNSLRNRLKLKSQFERLDRMTTIGHYGVLFLGLNDVSKEEDLLEPVDESKDDLELKYVKPYSEGSTKILNWEENPASNRYNWPKYYQLTIRGPNNRQNDSIKVHHSRVIHTVENNLENDIYGIPKLKPIFNRIEDLQKVLGGDPEMFWRGARPGYHFKVEEGFELDEEQKEKLRNRIEEYEHDLRRILTNTGGEINSLEPQVSDPSSHIRIQLEAICAYEGIPLRIFIGAEQGELASSEDKNRWLRYLKSRRSNYMAPNIIRPFVNTCVRYGILPDIDSYSVAWNDLWSPSEKQKAEIGNIRAKALNSYAQQVGAQEVLPPKAFFRFIMMLDEGDAEMVEKIKSEGIREEERFRQAVTDDEGGNPITDEGDEE